MEKLTWTTPGNLDTVCEGTVKNLHQFWESCPMYGVEVDLLRFFPGSNIALGAVLELLKNQHMHISQWTKYVNKKLQEAGAPFVVTSSAVSNMPNFVRLLRPETKQPSEATP